MAAVSTPSEGLKPAGLLSVFLSPAPPQAQRAAKPSVPRNRYRVVSAVRKCRNEEDETDHWDGPA
jgi:hypothetical protein